MAQYDVFISYCREDRAVACDLVGDSLNKEGYSVFTEKRSLRGGDRYRDKIREAIGSCIDFVLLLTCTSRSELFAKNADDNPDDNLNWMQWELSEACRLHKHIVILRDQCCDHIREEEKDALPKVIQGVHGIEDVVYNNGDWEKTEFDSLCKSLKSVPATDGKDAPQRRYLKFIVVAIALVLLAIVGFYLGVWPSSPKIEITEGPQYGVDLPIVGSVRYADGSEVDPASWRVAIFLQSQDGTLIPKPSYAKPYYELGPSGELSVDWVTGGLDSQSRVVHLLVVPSNYSSGDYDKAKDVAVDYVRFDLDDAGTYVMSHPDAEAS